MKYLKAYARICFRHSEKDCDGCPFSANKTGMDSCLKFILKNPEDAQMMIINYAKALKEKRDEEARRQRELDEFWGDK